MTAKEKAEELVDKMYMVEDPMGNYPMCYDTAKQCALIAVDEIMQHALNAYHNEDIIKGAKLYWNEVKHELNKSE